MLPRLLTRQSLHDSYRSTVKDLVSVLSSASTDVGVIGRSPDGAWRNWDLSDTARPMVSGVDTNCIGCALDLTSTELLPPREEDGPEVKPVPIMYIYNNHGELAAYRIFSNKALKENLDCPAMVKPTVLPQLTAKAQPKAQSKTQPTAGFGAPKLASVSPSVAQPSFSAPQTAKGSFGTAAKAPIALQGSSAPNPAFNPNPNFQLSKAEPLKVTPAAPKAPGVMQQLLQEPVEPKKIVRKKSFGEEPSAPAPKISPAMDALSRQLERTYLAMTEELQTLRSHVRETEQLIKAREHVFGELDQFMKVTVKRIKSASETKRNAENLMADVEQLNFDMIKGNYWTVQQWNHVESHSNPTDMPPLLL